MAEMRTMVLIKMLSLVTCYGHKQTKDADMASWPGTKKAAITGGKLNICGAGHQNFTPSK